LHIIDPYESSRLTQVFWRDNYFVWWTDFI